MVEADNGSTGQASNDSALYELSQVKYGMGYEALFVDLVICDDGSGIVTRTIDVVAASRISKLDAFLQSVAKDAGHEEIKLVAVEMLEGDFIITISRKISKQGAQSIEIAISPPLKPGQSLKYRIKEKLPVGRYSFISAEENLEDHREKDDVFGLHDYFGWHINRPTRYFQANVYFPRTWEPTIFSDVVYLATASLIPFDFKNEHEAARTQFKRIADSKRQCFALDLKVDYPMIGLVYAASWLPVHAKRDRHTHRHGETDIEISLNDDGYVMNNFAFDPNTAAAAATAVQMAYWFIAPGAQSLSQQVGNALGEVLGNNIRKAFGNSSVEPVMDDLLDGDHDELLVAQIGVVLHEEPALGDDIVNEAKKAMRIILRNNKLVSLGTIQVLWQDYGSPNVTWQSLVAENLAGEVQPYVSERLVDEALRRGKLPELIRDVRDLLQEAA